MRRPQLSPHIEMMYGLNVVGLVIREVRRVVKRVARRDDSCEAGEESRQER